MVYFEPSDLGLKPILSNWYSSLPKRFPTCGVEQIDELIDFSLDKGEKFYEPIYNSCPKYKSCAKIVKVLSSSKTEKVVLLLPIISIMF
jgi:hypothetical protein